MLKTSLFKSVAIFLIFACESCICNPSKIKDQGVECEYFKTGKFLYHSELSNENAIVVRDDTSQTETSSSGEFTNWKVTWKNECEYILEFKKSSKSELDSFSTWLYSGRIETKIIEATKDYYIFETETIGISPKLNLKDTMRVIK